LAIRSNATASTLIDFGAENVMSRKLTGARAADSACARSSARRSGPASGSRSSAASYTWSALR